MRPIDPRAAAAERRTEAWTYGSQRQGGFLKIVGVLGRRAYRDFSQF